MVGFDEFKTEREKIGEDVRKNTDQFFRFEQEWGKVVFESQESEVEDGRAVAVPAGSCHNVINTGSEDLRFYSIHPLLKHSVKVRFIQQKLELMPQRQNIVI